MLGLYVVLSAGVCYLHDKALNLWQTFMWDSVRVTHINCVESGSDVKKQHGPEYVTK